VSKENRRFNLLFPHEGRVPHISLVFARYGIPPILTARCIG
jgi:hypothetical protein